MACNLCWNKYERGIHRHLRRQCKGSCPTKCENCDERDLLIFHLGNPSNYAAHFTDIYMVIERIKSVIKCAVRSQAVHLEDAHMSIQNTKSKAVTQLEKRVSEQNSYVDSIYNVLSQVNKFEEYLHNSMIEMAILLPCVLRSSNQLAKCEQIWDRQDQGVSRLDFNIRCAKARRDSLALDGEIEDLCRFLDDFQMCLQPGKFLWTLLDVDELFNVEHIDAWTSAPFYSSPRGCLLSACADFHQRDCVSFTIMVDRGRYDVLIQWPFTFMLKTTIINYKNRARDFLQYCEVVINSPPPDDSFVKLANVAVIPSMYLKNKQFGFVENRQVNILFTVENELQE